MPQISITSGADSYCGAESKDIQGMCEVGLSRNRLILQTEMDRAQWPLPDAPGLPKPSGSPCCAQMHDWSIPHCRMKLTSFRHPSPKISSKKLVKSDTLRYLSSSWLYYSPTFHEQGASGSWQTKTAQKYGRSEAARILYTET